MHRGLGLLGVVEDLLEELLALGGRHQELGRQSGVYLNLMEQANHNGCRQG